MKHRISIPAYAIKQQWWQSDVPKHKMSLIFKNDACSLAIRVTMWLSFKTYWHASIWSSISFSYWHEIISHTTPTAGHRPPSKNFMTWRKRCNTNNPMAVGAERFWNDDHAPNDAPWVNRSEVDEYLVEVVRRKVWGIKDFLLFQIPYSRRHMQQLQPTTMGLHHDPGPTVPLTFLLRWSPSAQDIRSRHQASISSWDQFVSPQQRERGEPWHNSPAYAVGTIPGSWYYVFFAVQRVQWFGTEML
jgi:hypothetical protein